MSSAADAVCFFSPHLFIVAVGGNSTDRTHLKRKLDMNLALQQTPHG
jgi:hypothetical protein